MPPLPDPTRRFGGRVADYVRARPGYPPELMDVLRDHCGLGPASVVADVGSGTGTFTALLLDRAARVYGVEPNAEMAQAAEARLGRWPGFVSVRARAEETGLPASSVDLVTAAQAVHWFDLAAARREFARILRPGGFAALVWNSRRREGTPFLRDYEALLERWGTDYASVRRLGGDESAARAIFGEGGYERRVLANVQHLDRDLLRARLLSSSYVPAPDDPRRVPMLEDLDAIFEARRSGGAVTIEYETEVFWGAKVAPATDGRGRAP
jgi:SAM-dependent methyltransferase